MDFGKLTSVEGVDFTLPPDPDFNRQAVNNRQPQTQIYIGTTGYAVKEWVGSWYPPQSKPDAFLTHYGALFNTIEHNTTHYRIPNRQTVERWYQATPAGFKFCPKVPQTISHSRNFGTAHPDVGLFCDQIGHLKEKLGVCFLQLPPQFDLSQIARLEAFLRIWPTDQIPFAVEVRHASFFSTGLDQLLALLHAYRAYTVITDVAGRRDVCHMGLSGDKVLIRLVGNSMHPTDLTRLDAWMQRIGEWAQAGVQEVYLFCHQPDHMLMPEFCREAALRAQSLQHAGDFAIPNRYKPDSEQMSLF